MQPQMCCRSLCHNITCYPVFGTLRERFRRERPVAPHAQWTETNIEQSNTAQATQNTRLSQINIGSESMMDEQDLTGRMNWSFGTSTQPAQNADPKQMVYPAFRP
jgi:hypothetical protein